MAKMEIASIFDSLLHNKIKAQWNGEAITITLFMAYLKPTNKK